MKKILSLAVAVLAALSSAAQPILVGHRGSNYGLENSEESFRNGVKLGYKYLETDVKFTKDNILVCSHDDDTKRLGGTKELAKSTLEELQSETLTQTRLGQTYTGRLCSMKEYLQICKDAGIGALIELKWTAGINSNDCSKIPLLIAQIDEMDMRSNCIILTSMKPCLEYIRTNYPDIELQFLTGEKWASNFDWCVKWKIDADIQAGYFDRAAVKKFHSQGLKVNMWTTNDDAGYLNYGNMGCDFITTDRLDGHNLPELDPEITSPVNEVDYPETTFNPTLSLNYTLSEPVLTAWPAEFEGLKVRRAVRTAQGWYVLAHDAASEARLFFWADGAAPVAMDTDGLEDLSDIAMTADGFLLGSVLAPATNWKLYSWTSPEAEAEEVANLDDYYDIAGTVIGKSMTVSGRLNNLKIFTTAPEETALCAIEISKSKVSQAQCLPFSDAFGKGAAAEGLLTMSPMSRDNIVLSISGSAVEYTVDPAASAVSPLEDRPALLPAPAAFDWLRYGSHLYAATALLSDSGNLCLAIYDPEADMAVTMQRTLCVIPSGYVAVDFRAVAPGESPVRVFVEGEGVYTSAFDPEAAPQEAADVKLVLERQWIFSNTTDNFLKELDGTYARQGTGVNGRFYINNCNEKLLHVFDSTGHLGTLPGGAGYGCARDDAGNIIVRADASTGAEHTFLIYPVGSVPGSDVKPVELTVDFNLEGQTDFINASGDLLGADGGYIYLYPAKQTAVSIARILSGNLDRVIIADGLSHTATVAAYVVPASNNPLHWYYHIRSSSIKEYLGNTSVDLMAGRTGTTPPARNTTGGFAVIQEGGNRLLIHNSGANYMGGFTVRDMTLDRVITNVNPIGNLGYNDGNYSTFNWLIAERNDAFDYTIYQYCPANGIAVYRLADASGVEDAAVENTAEINYDGEVISAPGAMWLTVCDITGRTLATVRSTSGLPAPEIETATLPRGLLIVRTPSSTAKILNR
ncbi:MAG: hypothetical protein K2M19_00555 [Muribaculaceae bacterium]|nr:hypothetical protein [Muribaculaceae bacterium]